MKDTLLGERFRFAWLLVAPPFQGIHRPGGPGRLLAPRGPGMVAVGERSAAHG
jgi:hypothetical protein